MYYRYVLLDAGEELDKFLTIATTLPFLPKSAEQILADLVEIASDSEIPENRMLRYLAGLIGSTDQRLSKEQQNRLIVKAGDLCTQLIRSVESIVGPSYLGRPLSDLNSYVFKGQRMHSVILENTKKPPKF